ncbi:PP2C family protein-serine/threonine phosphatase [Acanthopleuribacter pedis]|uniref:Protein phosphatase 2C domain-containing protein n=1 Tax=Acanthopleuribacter pedis TaxID=442870 RepID=A0A8J7QCI4_9BACT|nr:protein phosphatase 2C domain-containing protein [Acanthopleuribacter pedis]MBO1321609.1 protein phosphatase 2C domain-containing protein [Acanthopleuribacter pedis]
MVFAWFHKKAKKDEALKIRWYVCEKRGTNRETIEDAHLVSRTDAANGVFYAAVADGMGGHHGGAFASRNAIRILEDTLSQAIYRGDWVWPSRWGDGFKENPLLENILKKAIYTTDVKITELSKNTKGMADMGSTLTAVGLAQSSLYFIHAGDTRLYHLKDDAFSQLTIDHAFNLRSAIRARDFG